MNKLIEYLREWSKDYNAAQKELNDMGLFTAYHQWGAYVHYNDPELSTHINNTDDRQDTIPKNNR
jgi:hypothetical protein